jgi:hypothetical protein
MKHRIVETNRIKMHLAERGDGPLVVLCLLAASLAALQTSLAGQK